MGVETVTLTEAQMPNHTHALMARATPATANTPTTETTLARSVGGNAYNNTATANATLNTNALAPAGGGQAHNNMQPYLAMYFIIALTGTYPTRS